MESESSSEFAYQIWILSNFVFLAYRKIRLILECLYSIYVEFLLKKANWNINSPIAYKSNQFIDELICGFAVRLNAI